MKKITGKVVSLVLALALVVTSFSSTFAFAATKSEDGTVSLGNDTIYLVSGDKDAGTDLGTLITATMDTKDHNATDGTVEISAVSHFSGDKLLTWDTTTAAGKANLKLKSADVATTGTEVLSVLFTTTTERDDATVTVKAKATVTVKVVKKDSYVLSESATATFNDGITAPDEIGTFAKTDSKVISVYKVTDAAKPLATYAKEAVNAWTLTTDPTTAQDPKITVTAATGTIAIDNDSAKNLTIKATEVAAPNTAITAKTKIANKVIAPATATTITTYGGETYFTNGGDVKTDANRLAKITGCDVVLNTNSITMEKGSVKDVTGTKGITVTKGSVSSITVDGAVAVDGGTIGKIVAKDTVTVTDGSVASVEVKSNKDAQIKGGTVKGEIKADKVVVTPTDEKVVATVGSITTKDLTVNSDTAKVTTGAIKLSDDGSIALEGENTVVGAIDFDYRTATLNFNGFKGTVTSLAHSDGVTVNVDSESDVTINGTVSVSALDVTAGGKVALTGSVTIDEISGAGSMTVGAGKLLVKSSISGTTVKLSDKTLTPGTVVFKATSDAVAVEDFEAYGYTAELVAGDKIDSIKIKTVDFAGLTLNKTSSKIAVGYKETFTVTNYPTGTNLPKDTKIKWDFSGSDEYFNVTYTGNTATVEVKKIDTDFASENKGVLTASLVDADDYDLSDDYTSATCDIEGIAKPAYVSDTNADFAVVAGASYTFKITSDTAPVVTLGTPGVFTVAPVVKNGNAYFVKITAVGAAGKATGVYINGNKLLVASVKAPVVKCDTTVNVKVAAGKSYTYKVTADKAPSFGLGTPGVFTVSKITNSGTNYFFTITATGKSGAATGVFVNGVKVNVATVA